MKLIASETSMIQDVRALILNSRQSKTPCGNDSWVKNTILSVDHCVDNGWTLVSSIGMNTWELALARLSTRKGKGIILITDVDSQHSVESVISDFGLERDNVEFVFISGRGRIKGRKYWWDDRDSIAYEMADYVIPVSIRDGGRWSQMLYENSGNKKTIDDHRVAFEKSRKSESLPIPSGIKRQTSWDYLTHWTRRFHGPWAGERSIDYYEAVMRSGGEYPRKASDTLRRILAEKCLRGSSERVRNGARVVAFTLLEPYDSIKLMKWRARYVRYTFEPYGISIRKDVAMEMGIKPVRYEESNGKSAREDEFTQGYGKGEWYRESEWRQIGDMDLSLLDPKDIRIIVPTSEEAKIFGDFANYDVISLESLT